MPSPSISAEDACRTLEIKIGATETEIKAAYKKLALKTHPDKNPNDATASKRFLAVSEAYKRLTDEEFSDEDDYDDYDENDEDFDISEIFAFRMFERMFFEASNDSGGQSRRDRDGSNGSTRNTQSGRGDSGGVQFSFPGMGGGGGCNCPDCRRRFGYEKAKPWREYVPKSQRTDLPKETIKEVDPSIHDNWLSDEDEEPKHTKGISKTKSKKAQKRENAAKEQKAQIERQERQARENQAKDHQHHSHHSNNQDIPPEATQMHTNKVNKLKLKQEEERLKLEQERAKKALSKKKGKEVSSTSSSSNQKSKKQQQKDQNEKMKNKQKNHVESDENDDDEDDDDSDLDIEEIATRMGITDNSSTKNTSTKNTSSSKSSASAAKGNSQGTTAEFTTNSSQSNHKYSEQIKMLQEMGFEYGACLHAIETSFGSVELAATMLLQSQMPEEPPSAPSTTSNTTSRTSTKKSNVSAINASTKRAPSSLSSTSQSTTAATRKPVVNNTVPKQATTSAPSLSVNKSTSQALPKAVKHATILSTNSNTNQAPSYLKASTVGVTAAATGTKASPSTGVNLAMPVSQTKNHTISQMPPQLPPGFMGQASKSQAGQHMPRQLQPQNHTQNDRTNQKSSIFSTPGSGPPPLHEHNRGPMLNNTQNFDYFNQHQQSSTSPNSQSSPVSLSSQAMPMPAQQQQPAQHQSASFPLPQQSQQQSGDNSSSKFFSLFAPSESEEKEPQMDMSTPSLSDLLLNSESTAASSNTKSNNESTELYPSIFESMLPNSGNDGVGDNSNINMSGLGLDMGGLGGGNNSSSTSLSSLLGGDQSHVLSHDPISNQSLNHDNEGDGLGVGSLLGDISALIGGDSGPSASSSQGMSLETMLGTPSFLLNGEPDPLLSDVSYASQSLQQEPTINLTQSLNTTTAASIVKNGNSNGLLSGSNSNSFHSSPTSTSGMMIPSPGPSSPGSVSSSGSSTSKCMYFFTARGCRHGASCKFSHSMSGNTNISNDNMRYDSNSTGHKTLYNPQTGRNVSVGVGSGVGSLSMSKKPCMFFSTPQGCKHGSSCRFVHNTKHK